MNLWKVVPIQAIVISWLICDCVASTYTMSSTDESECNNGGGCDNENGWICHSRQCVRCSPCLDIDRSTLSSSLDLVKQCYRHGHCPYLCTPLRLFPSDPVLNQTFCKKLNKIIGVQQVTEAVTTESPTTVRVTTLAWMPTTLFTAEADNGTTKRGAESRPSGNIPKGDGSLPTNTLVTITGVLAALFVTSLIIHFVKKMMCRKPQSSPGGVEGALLEYEIEVVETSPSSISIQARTLSRRKKEKVKLCCRTEGGTEETVRWSNPMQWGVGGRLQHTFSELRPGSEYVIILHTTRSQRAWTEVKSITAATQYYPLQVDLNQGQCSATVKGLQQCGCSAVDVCPCLHSDDKRWLDVPSGADELPLSYLTPGFKYTVRAGIVIAATSRGSSRNQLFLCLAKGELDMREISEEQGGWVCSTTVGDILGNFPLRKSLQVELDDRSQHYLPELIGTALSLSGDDLRQVKNAQPHEHLESLHGILESQDRLGTAIHELMECLVYDMEAKDFMRKLAKRSDSRCIRCMHLLHRTHAEENQEVQTAV